MPQDKLTELLMNRPVSVNGDIRYPKAGDPGVVDDKAMRALGVALGIEDQKPGDLAGALGGALGAVSLIPPGLAKLRGPEVIKNAISRGMPPHIIEALEMAQQRWPRLFGHTPFIDNLSDLPPMPNSDVVVASSQPLSRATTRMQQAYPGMEKKPPQGFVSALGLNPDKITTRDKAANAIGHELLHSADSITIPEANDQYKFNNGLPGGYYSNNHEVRARLQGARTEMYAKGVPRRSFEPVTGTASNATDIIPKLDSRISSLPPETPQEPQLDPRDRLFDLVGRRLFNDKEY